MGLHTLLAMPDTEIDRVVFYKRDEMTTDMICCDIHCGDTVYFAHEEASGWNDLVARLERLPGFASGWFARVSQPPFASSEIVAFDWMTGESNA